MIRVIAFGYPGTGIGTLISICMHMRNILAANPAKIPKHDIGILPTLPSGRRKLEHPDLIDRFSELFAGFLIDELCTG